MSIPKPSVEVLGALRKKKYAIPPFQRDFVWGRTELELMKNDLLTCWERDERARFGALYTYTLPGDSVHHLVDGQQRMTSLLMLDMALMRFTHQHGASLNLTAGMAGYVLLGDSEDKVRPVRIQFQHKNTQKWIEYVAQNPNDDSKSLRAKGESIQGIVRANLSEESKASRAKQDSSRGIVHSMGTHLSKTEIGTLLRALDFWMDFVTHDISNWGMISREESFERIQGFTAHIKQSLFFVVIDVDDPVEALLDFEKLNSRGQKLSPLDLIKSLLIQSAPDKKQVHIQTEWEKVLNAVGTTKTGGRILRRIVVSGMRESAYKDISVSTLYGWITKTDNAPLLTRTDYLLTTMVEGCQFQARLDEGRGFDKSILTVLDRLKFLGVCELSSIALMHGVVLERERRFDLLIKLFNATEAVCTVDYFCSIQSKTTEQKLIELARLFHECTKVGHDVDQALILFFKNFFTEMNSRRKVNFATGIMACRYGDPRTRFILARLSQVWDEALGAVSKDFATYVDNAYEVDHTYPDTRRLDLSEPDLVNTIGNLALLATGANQSKGRKLPHEALDVYKPDYAPAFSRAILEPIQAYGSMGKASRAAQSLPSYDAKSTVWSQSGIESRTRDITRMMECLYGVPSSPTKAYGFPFGFNWT